MSQKCDKFFVGFENSDIQIWSIDSFTCLKTIKRDKLRIRALDGILNMLSIMDDSYLIYSMKGLGRISVYDLVKDKFSMQLNFEDSQEKSVGNIFWHNNNDILLMTPFSVRVFSNARELMTNKIQVDLPNKTT